MAILPGVTVDNNRILIIRLIDYNAEKLVFDDALTVFTMIYDTSVIIPEPDQLADGEIVIFDIKGLSAKHLANMSLSSLRCFVKYMLDVHPIRLSQVHVINSHSLLDKILMVLRPFIGSKAFKAIRFHRPDTTTCSTLCPESFCLKNSADFSDRLSRQSNCGLKTLKITGKYFPHCCSHFL